MYKGRCYGLCLCMYVVILSIFPVRLTLFDSVKGLLDLNRTPLTINYLLLVCYCFSTFPLKYKKSI